MISHLTILAVLFAAIVLFVGLLMRSIRPPLYAVIVFIVVRTSFWYAYSFWSFFVERQYASLRLPAFYLGGVFYYPHVWLPLLSGFITGISAALLCAHRIYWLRRRQRP